MKRTIQFAGATAMPSCKLMVLALDRPITRISKSGTDGAGNFSTVSTAIYGFRTDRNDDSYHDLFQLYHWLGVHRTLCHALDYLCQAESKEADAWYRQDYRLASAIIGLVDDGSAHPYAIGFFQMFGRPAQDVTWWWRDRAKLLQLSQLGNYHAPLFLANQAAEVLSQIPDYDPQVSADISGDLPPKRPASRATTSSGERDAGRKKAL